MTPFYVWKGSNEHFWNFDAIRTQRFIITQLIDAAVEDIKGWH